MFAQLTKQIQSSNFFSTLVSSVNSFIRFHYKSLAQGRPVFWPENLVFGKFVEKCPNCFSGQTCRGRQEASITPSPRSTRPPSTSFSRATLPSANRYRIGKNPVKKKKLSPVGFFWGGGGVWVFGFFFLYICPEERVFRVYFSFKNSFRFIQTLNYNHSLLINLFLQIYASALD
jgi:hypothetical protein